MRGIRPSHKQHVGILPDDVSRVPKLYKSCLPCRSSTNPHRRCPRVHSPVSSPSVHTTTFGAHRGAKCAWIHNSMGPNLHQRRRRVHHHIGQSTRTHQVLHQQTATSRRTESAPGGSMSTSPLCVADQTHRIKRQVRLSRLR